MLPGIMKNNGRESLAYSPVYDDFINLFASSQKYCLSNQPSYVVRKEQGRTELTDQLTRRG